MLGIPRNDQNNEPKFNGKITENDKQLMSMIDSYDLKMLDYLKKLYAYLGGDYIDVASVEDIITIIMKVNKKKTYQYLENLLYPERKKGVKIPSPIPVPSCSFQLHNCVTLTTNSTGNLAFVFNPYFLYDNNCKNEKVTIGDADDSLVSFFSTLHVNNDARLTGNDTNDNFYPVNIGQDIPGVYSQYRLVSASVVLKYIGRLDIASGVCGGAIVFNDSNKIGGRVKVNSSELSTTFLSDNAKYGNFDLAMDSFYHQENLCLEGLRMLYFPVDNSYEEYVKLQNIGDHEIKNLASSGVVKMVCLSDEDKFKNGFNFLGYVLGAPPSAACFKLDIYCNFECIPSPEYLNYMPISMNSDTITDSIKKESISYIQEKPVMKSTEFTSVPIVEEKSIWRIWKDKFKGKLPGIMKLAQAGLIKAIPFMKTGLAVAGSMMNAYRNKMEEDVD